MIKLKRFTFNPFSENTYIVWDESSKDSVIIDPGCYNNKEETELADFISGNGLTVKYLINTHCHIDHILGNKFIQQKYSPICFIPETEVELYENGQMQAEMFGVKYNSAVTPTEFLNEKTEIKLGQDTQMIPLLTPGHTVEEYCLYFPVDKFCITGDVLFKESIGRTDLWGGSYEQIISSIKNKLLTLPDDVKIYPGHGSSTTIYDEKKFNPFIS
jgi:hydroxyacylglutathione hydrolase